MEEHIDEKLQQKRGVLECRDEHQASILPRNPSKNDAFMKAPTPPHDIELVADRVGQLPGRVARSLVLRRLDR